MQSGFRRLASSSTSLRHHEGPGLVMGIVKPEPDRLVRRSIKIPKTDWPMIRDEYSNGKSFMEIAEERGVSRTYIAKICKGVELGRSPKRGRPLGWKDPEKVGRNKKIRERYAEGNTAKEIAKRFGVSLGSIFVICKGVKREKERRIINEEEKVKIREEYSEGKTAKEIADGFGVTVSSVFKICKGVKREKIPKRGRPLGWKDPEKAERNGKIREEYSEGKTAKEIAGGHGVSLGYVFKICKGVERKNIPKRGRPLGWKDPKKVKRNRKIRKEYAEGKTAKEIAKRFGVTLGTVFKICKGVKREKGHRRIKEKTLVRLMYLNGKTQIEIAKEFGVSNGTIFKICRGMRREKVPEKDWQKIRDEYANGKSLREIAGERRVSHNYIAKICKKVEGKMV